MKDKKVVVMMSVYNGGQYLKSQLDSILNQKGSFLVDIFIRDDGSTDDSQKIIKDYANKHSQIYYILGKNIGCNASYFELIKQININQYDYFSFSDQDDVWLDNKLETAINFLLNKDCNKPLLYGSTSSIVKKDLVPLRKTQSAKKQITLFNTIIQNIIPGHTQVMNKYLLNMLKKDLNISKIYVYDSWVANMAVLYGEIIFDNTPHTLYRMHDKNVQGFGTNYFSWIMNRLKKLRSNDLYKYSVQINYFIHYNWNYFSNEQKLEFSKFIDMNTSLVRRILYIISTKFYRQSYFQTLGFKILYLLGFYSS